MNKEENSLKLTSLIAASVALVAYVYVALRAYYVSPFCDEVISFFDYIRPGDIQPFYARTDANNHVINSALSRGFYLLFGEGIFVLRIANLLAFGVYLSYLFKFKTFFKNNWVWLAWFGVMVVPQYFLDFFHLSRGYGLSMAFLVASCFHLLSFERNSKLLHFGLACVWISLAVWSNLSLTLTSSLVGLWLLHSWLVRHRSAISNSSQFVCLLLFVAFFIAPLIYAVLYGFELKDAGMLYYGADSGFWDKSIIMTAKWIADDWILGGVLVINALFVYLLLVGYNFRSRKEKGSIGPHLLFWGTITGIVLMHHLLGVKYPVDRSTTHLFLLFFTILFFEIDRSEQRKAVYAGFSLLTFLSYNTIADLNLSRTRLWSVEHVPIEFFHELEKWKKQHGTTPSLAAHGLHRDVLSYYDYIFDGNLNLVEKPGHPNPYHDFVVIRENNHRPDSASYETLFFSERTGTGLFKRRLPVDWTEVETKVNSVPDSMREYFNVAKFDLSKHNDKAIQITVDFEASGPVPFRDLQLVLVQKDSTGRDVVYEQVNLRETHPIIANRSNISAKFLIGKPQNEAKEALIFIWNVRKLPLTIERSSASLFTAPAEKISLLE